MTPTEAIERLETFGREPDSGSGPMPYIYTDIADVIRGLQDEVKIVQGWSDKWSTEHRKLTEACKLVLLFHGGGPWDEAKRNEWSRSMKSILHGVAWPGAPSTEATTKNLCDAVRAALKGTP